MPANGTTASASATNVDNTFFILCPPGLGAKCMISGLTQARNEALQVTDDSLLGTATYSVTRHGLYFDAGRVGNGPLDENIFETE
jgi:hypothetical protein